MTSAELERAETRMRQKWYDLVMAEQQGASMQTLERMYNGYILAVEEYNHCSRQLHNEQPGAAPAQRIRQKRKAS